MDYRSKIGKCTNCGKPIIYISPELCSDCKKLTPNDLKQMKQLEEDEVRMNEFDAEVKQENDEEMRAGL